jgi:hypothetical protein
MRRVLFVIILLALFCGGCIEKKSNEGKVVTPLSVMITSPKGGTIVSGDKEVRFDSTVNGGNSPYTYNWDSNVKGMLSSSKSFSMKPSKLGGGRHIIILKVTDAKGKPAEATTMIDVV